MKSKFDIKMPEGFLWGAAASAPQTEGASDVDGKSASTWDMWFEMNPELFDNNIGPKTASNVYYDYREDILRMKEMNLNSYRTSISWTRLLPDGKTLNHKAVSYYRDYFSVLKESGIEPIINLFHFDMPWWQMEKGGWEDPEISDNFAYYAQVAAEQFGDIVTYWTTFNEPIVHVECSYLYGYHYPAIHDFKLAVLCAYQTILAHAKAISAMRNVNSNLKLGTILNLSPTYPRSNSVEDLKAAHLADLLSTRSFLDGMLKGTFDDELITLLKDNALLPTVSTVDLEVIASVSLDFLGVNYYQPRRVKEPNTKEIPAQSPAAFYSHYEWSERRMNPYRGWEIYPEGLLDIAKLLQEEYDNIPWYLSENGMGVADEERFIDDNNVVQDDYRIEFIYDHLKVLQQIIENGSHCFGYHLWTFVDCWSWLNGYRNRYGFYRVDLLTQKRYPKASSFWMRELIEINNTNNDAESLKGKNK